MNNIHEELGYLPITAFTLGMKVIGKDAMYDMIGHIVAISISDETARNYKITVRARKNLNTQSGYVYHDFNHKDVKPILKSIDTMYANENNIYNKLAYFDSNGTRIETGEAKDFARSLGYDTDDYIGMKLAIDERILTHIQKQSLDSL